MWRMVFVREITPGRTGFLFIVHHCVADGIGTVAHALNLLRPRLDLPVGERPAPGGIKKAVGTVVGLAQLATDGRPEARLPEGSPLRGFAAAGFDLGTVRGVARTHGARVTDLVMSLLATAVDRKNPEFAASVGHRLRVSVPIMLREPGSVAEGNVTAAAMIDLPLAGMNANDRFKAIRKSSAGLRTPTRALASRFVMTDVLALVPTPIARWFARAVYAPAFVQGIVSNMAGPTKRMSIAGVPFERVVPILPLAPGAPLALGALSWTGVLGMGLAVDPRFLDADSLVAAMGQALRELVDADSAAHRAGEMPPRHGSHSGR
jgi:diacylglycerol O-acyltransferase